MVDKSIYYCECGGRTVSTKNKKGYPSRKCVDCGMDWFFTTCWKCGANIDERFVTECHCGYYHCNQCQKCKPKGDLLKCNCIGNCKTFKV